MTREEKNKLKEEQELLERKKERKRKILKITIITFIFIFIFLFMIIYYMRFFEVKSLKVKEIKIEDKLISDNFNGFKIVHISDIHYKMTTDSNDLKKIVNKINILKPDVVVFTGDLLDKSIKYGENDYKVLENILKKIEVKISKYYIKGEHDYKFVNTDLILENADFINLINKEDNIYLDSNDYIKFIGYGSSIKKDFKYEHNKTEMFTISLIHEPDNSKKISNSHLILAGHSHNLQVNIPYIKDLYKYKGCNNYYNEYYKLGKSKLYINSGIGTSNYRLRLFNPPTINFYRLVKK